MTCGCWCDQRRGNGGRGDGDDVIMIPWNNFPFPIQEDCLSAMLWERHIILLPTERG
jgi:hypothetical protein